MNEPVLVLTVAVVCGGAYATYRFIGRIGWLAKMSKMVEERHRRQLGDFTMQEELKRYDPDDE